MVAMSSGMSIWVVHVVQVLCLLPHLLGEGGVDKKLHRRSRDHCDSYTACSLCRLEPRPYDSRFLGLVSVSAARSLDQTELRPSVIKRMTLNT